MGYCCRRNLLQLIEPGEEIASGFYITSSTLNPCYMKFLFIFLMMLFSLPRSGKGIPFTSLPLQQNEFPKFPGGDAEWRKYLERNINRDIPVMDDKAEPGCYTIRGSFQIDVQGNVTDIQFLKNSFPKMTAELIRVIKASPKWLPLLHNGKAVVSRKEVHYQFLIQTE